MEITSETLIRMIGDMDKTIEILRDERSNLLILLKATLAKENK